MLGVKKSVGSFEVMLMEYRFKTPLTMEDISRLKTGDIVYLSGVVYTARDKAHQRILSLADENKEPPFPLNGQVIYHCGPLARKRGETWEIVAAGPTTSARMNSSTVKLLDRFEVRAIIGKGGMSEEVSEAMKGKCVYLAYTGGAAAIAAQAIKEVKKVYWEDLGMPEAVWVLEVEDFGPMVTGIDTEGNNLFIEVEKDVEKKFSEMFG